MVLFTLGDEIASALTSIEITHGVINPAFKSRLRSIRRKRMKLYAQETMGASVTDGLQTLVDEMLQLQEDICSKYTVPNSIINKFKRCWFKVKKFLFGVFSGLLMAIIIFVVFPVNPISTINSLLQQLNIPTQINAYGQENSNKE
jgi:hypothetical protein